MKLIWLFLFYVLFVSAARAGYMTTEFIQRNEIVLAQFMAYTKMTKEEFLRLDVTLATLRDRGVEGVQFYLVYRPGKEGKGPRYYYLIDRKMKSSWPLLDFGMYGDEQIIPNSFLPDYLVDDQVTIGKKKQPDAFSYFGEVDPIDTEFYKLKTENGYKIELERYGFHSPGRSLLNGDNETEHLQYLRNNYPQLLEKGIFPFQPKYFATGNLKAKDQMTQEERAAYLAKEELDLLLRQATPQYAEAVNNMLVRVNTFIERYNQMQVKRICKAVVADAKAAAKKGGPQK